LVLYKIFAINRIYCRHPNNVVFFPAEYNVQFLLNTNREGAVYTIQYNKWPQPT